MNTITTFTFINIFLKFTGKGIVQNEKKIRHKW
jgi:hypothetical protein